MHDHAPHAAAAAISAIRSGRSGPRFTAPCLLLLALAATIVSGSFLLHPTDLHLPACSEPWDAAIYPWNCFTLAESVAAPSDGSLLFTNRFYWPHGEGLGLYTPTWVHGVISLPFQWIGDWIGSEAQSRHVAVAALLWLASVATALLAFALARELGLGCWGAFLVGLLATVASGRLMNAARLNLFCTEFLLLYLLLGLRVWRAGGVWRALAFGFSAALLLLQSQPLLFQAAIVTTVFVVAALFSRDSRRRLLERIPAFGGALLVFLLLGAPFLWEIVRELPRSPGYEQAAALTPQGSLDLAELFVPHEGDRFAAFWSALLPLRAPSFFEWGGPLGTVSHFLGAGFLALAILGVLGRADSGGAGDARLARRSLAFALVLLLIAVGPVLKIGGKALAPMPYALLAYVPPLALEKSPARLVWLVQVLLAIAAARGFEKLAFDGDGRWRRRAGIVALALALATLLEQGETVPLRSIAPRVRIPDEVTAMAREPRSFAVLDLPYDSRNPWGEPSHAVNGLAMAFGAAHERPIFFGLYPRAVRAHEGELAARPLFAAIHRIETSARDQVPPPEFGAEELAAVRRDLVELSIGAVQVHDVAFDPERFPGERVRLRDFLRRLGPEREISLQPGNSYSVTLFRF